MIFFKRKEITHSILEESRCDLSPCGVGNIVTSYHYIVYTCTFVTNYINYKCQSLYIILPYKAMFIHLKQCQFTPIDAPFQIKKYVEQLNVIQFMQVIHMSILLYEIRVTIAFD